MPQPNSLPVLGVAMKLSDLEETDGLRDFIFDLQRDVELQDFIDVEALRGDWQGIAKRAQKAFDGHTGRIGIHGPFLGFALDTPDPDIRAIAKARLDAGIEACRMAANGREGATFVVHSPYSTRRWYNRNTRRHTSDRLVELVHLSLGDAAKKAADHGITIVIENIEDKDPAERVALAASFASPAVKVSLDTGHAHYAYGVTGAPPVDVYIREAGNALAHVHLQDADGFADRHWQIGHGNICWPSVFQALRELDEMPRLIIEMNNIADALPSAKWLEMRNLAM